MTEPRRRVITSSFEGAREIAHIKLSKGQTVRLLAEDCRRLEALGVSLQWTLNGNGGAQAYVCGFNRKVGKNGRGLIRIARLIADARAGQVVRYLDNDRLNLLPENLVVRSGRSFGRELSAVQG